MEEYFELTITKLLPFGGPASLFMLKCLVLLTTKMYELPLVLIGSGPSMSTAMTCIA